MATISRSELIDLVLQHMVVLAVGQSANAEDAELVGKAIDSAHDRLNKFGLVPFSTDLIPEWAQIPLRDYVAGDVGASFGFGDNFKPGQQAAKRELEEQMAGNKHQVRNKVEYF